MTTTRTTRTTTATTERAAATIRRPGGKTPSSLAFLAAGLWIFSAATLVLAGAATTTENPSEKAVPTFTFEDLRQISKHGASAGAGDSDSESRNHHTRIEEFWRTLSTTGLLAVRLDGETGAGVAVAESYSSDRRAALDGLCSCVDHPGFLGLDQTHSMVLDSSSTVRTSVATATAGKDHPLPLPAGLEDACGQDVLGAMEGLRDALSSVSGAFAEALDGALGTGFGRHGHGHRPLLRTEDGKSYRSVSEIVRSANHLEHFHVYTREPTGGGNDDSNDSDNQFSSSSYSSYNNHDDDDDGSLAWDWHTDAGLFLVFVPAWDCSGTGGGDDGDDRSFYYREGGAPVRARFDGGRTAVVMLGQGAQDWLDLPVPLGQNRGPVLKATSHSVRWQQQHQHQHQQQEQQRRAWYGMMNLVPENSLVYGGKTLAETKRSLSLSHQSKQGFEPPPFPRSGISLGCGDHLPSGRSGARGDRDDNNNDNDESPSSLLLAPSRRRLSMQDASMCNNATNFFCWMTCMEIPKVDQAGLYAEAGYSLYCVDEATLASSGDNVTKAHEACLGVHNAACKGAWEKTVPGLPGAPVETSGGGALTEEPFCYGGTTMYMEGFHWIQTTTCVVWLFPSWILDTAGKYAAAVIGTVFLAVGLEKFIQQRRKTMAYMEAGPRRLVVSAVFYGIQLTIGYLLMLVIMIYSVSLFASVILGLVLGHVMFNAKDAIWPIHELPGFDDLGSDSGIDDESESGVNLSEMDSPLGSPKAAKAAGSASGSATTACGNSRSCTSGRSSSGGGSFCNASTSISTRFSGASGGEERAMREGSTHCQDFDCDTIHQEQEQQQQQQQHHQHQHQHHQRHHAPNYEYEYYGSMGETRVGSLAAGKASPPPPAAPGSKKKKKPLHHGVPEGSTPCCQHGL